jgi:hydroxymethylpyrimidine pyrophosphatase-like HAD family hydrolase
VVINTGRDLTDARYIGEAMQCSTLRYYLLEHSAYAWDVALDREVNLGQLASEQGDVNRAKRYEQIKDIGILIHWYREHGQALLSERLNGEAPPGLGKRANLSIPVPEGHSADVVLKELKACIEEHFLRGQTMELDYCHSHFFVDVLGPVHKSDGAFTLSAHLGIDPKATLAIGDGMNDTDIFEVWPNLLCPANAHPPLKALCRQRGGIISKERFAEASLGLLNRWD